MIASRGMRRGCGAPWSARRTLSSVPKWSFHGRPLPSELVALESSTGRQMFARALNGGTAECYFRLANQFLTQSSPPSCGVTSLAMILNAMNVDPNRRWKGGWREAVTPARRPPTPRWFVATLCLLWPLVEQP